MWLYIQHINTLLYISILEIELLYGEHHTIVDLILLLLLLGAIKRTKLIPDWS